ncbi:hypothetical protein A3K86_03605 [Photobacterium jeanii]|uniref:Uncharacterized protein n=1 Tax=Photobacterium jeanii TaxID=858640 RepID=A0A178KKV9_9GAMM|nr:hypothetical protein [Photobacterium jeanii]OAN18018.1 hypothetical protein A3K86_03605 [Photobacterium jeanii]PST92313.1 hypothetical protein C9I91_03835 [Photobacterium jeanii]
MNKVICSKFIVILGCIFASLQLSAQSFSLDKTLVETSNELGFKMAKDIKVGEVAYLQPVGFSVCKENGKLKLNGLAIVGTKIPELSNMYMLQNTTNGIVVESAGMSLGYMGYYNVAMKIASSRKCSELNSTNPVPMLDIVSVFGVESLSELINEGLRIKKLLT